jgi:nucleoside 2-deoxyribosyltransferase
MASEAAARPRAYFAGSIRGGREDAALYADIIAHLRTKAEVLTEHVGVADVEKTEVGRSDSFIYERDMAWLRSSDFVVAEVTTPSLGVGYELAAAEALRLPVLALFRPAGGRSLSAMIRGCASFIIVDYTDLAAARDAIDAHWAALTRAA